MKPIVVIYRPEPGGEIFSTECNWIQIENGHLACYHGNEKEHGGPLLLKFSQVMALQFDAQAKDEPLDDSDYDYFADDLAYDASKGN